MDKLKKIPWLIVGVSGVISVLFFIFWMLIAFNGQTQKLEAANQENIKLARQYKSKTEKLSPDDVLNTLKKENINVTTSLDEVTKNIKEAVNLTYNKTKTEKDYKQLSNKLPGLVGKSLSYTLIQLDKPELNQSGKKAFAYGSTTDVLVTFGKYNYKTIEVPVYLVVDYKTPPTVGSGQKLNGQDLFTLTYNLKTKELGVMDHERGSVNNDE